MNITKRKLLTTIAAATGSALVIAPVSALTNPTINDQPEIIPLVQFTEEELKDIAFGLTLIAMVAEQKIEAAQSKGHWAYELGYDWEFEIEQQRKWLAISNKARHSTG